MTDRQNLQAAARAAKHAAARFTERGQTDEAAISELMADRYTDQLTETKRS